MNDKSNSNINLNQIYSLHILKEIKNEGIIDISQEKKIELDNNKYFNSKKATKLLKSIIEVSDNIIYADKSKRNLLNKNQFNLHNSNLNTKLTEINLKKSNLILLNKEQYIKLISPLNSKLANISNQIYIFTNKSYKQMNKNLKNLHFLCKIAFLKMSSIISKPIIFNNPNLIKITLFYYWKPSRKISLKSNLHSKFLNLYNNKLEKLVNLLNTLFNKSVELELIRIYSPQNESNILANLIGILSNFIKFRYIHMKLFKVTKMKIFKKKFIKNKIPSFLSGFYLKLAGRVLTQKIQRRVRSKVIQKGNLTGTKTELINLNRILNKNKRGTFSITIKTGHIIL